MKGAGYLVEMMVTVRMLCYPARDRFKRCVCVGDGGTSSSSIFPRFLGRF